MKQDETIDHYRSKLRHIGSELIKLSGNDDYIRRLIEGNNLLPIDRALRDFIEQFRE